MKRSIEDLLDAVAGFLRQATSVLFVTGAGISAESGIPTYRGIGGLYEDVETEEGIPIETALSGEMMRENPALTWKYLHQIELASRGAEPNRAHRVLAEAERRFERVWVLTQNVDGFHRAAGSENVIDIHGDIHTLVCTACDDPVRVEDFSGLAPLPICAKCRAPLRPDVVLFGELLPPDKVDVMHRELEKGFDVVFSIGTTSLFPYISRPVLEAKARGKPTVEINPSETVLSTEVDAKLPLGAVDALEALSKQLTSAEDV